MWYKLLNKITGFYLVRMPEKHGARLMNALNEEKALFWGAKNKDGHMYMRFSAFSAPHALRTAKSAAVDVEIVKAVGLPFIIHKYRKRHGLAFGTLLGLGLMLYSTLYVWKIDITGNKEIPDKMILTALAEAGVDIGTYIPKIHYTRVRTALILNLTELSSASVNIKGNHVTVDVIERKRPPEIADYSGYCHIVAARDGQIVSMEAYAGRPLAKAGDVVTKGQVLITGQYLSFRGLNMLTRARGRVMAVAYMDFVISVPLKIQYKRYTENTDIKVSYHILGRDFNLFLGALSPFTYFETEVKGENLKLGFLKLPAVKTTLYTREYVRESREISPGEARERALRAFYAWCENDTEGPVIKREYEIIEDPRGGCVTLVGTAEILLDIAKEMPFDPVYEFPEEMP